MPDLPSRFIFPAPSLRWKVGGGILGLFFTVPLSTCSLSQDERVKELEALAATSPASAVEEVDKELQLLRRENTTTLSAQSVPRILKSSLDGTTAAWLENGSLWISKPSGESSLFVDEKAIFFQISPDGRYAVVTKTEGSACRAVAVNVQEKKHVLLDGTFDCGDTPVVAEGGHTFFLPEKGGITIIDLESGKTRTRIQPDSFPKKFTRVPARFVITELTDNSVLIFHGAAGAYRLYHLPAKGTAPRLISDAVARPVLYSPGRGDKKNIGYVYGGTAGRYFLRPLTGNPPALLEGRKAPASPQAAVDAAGRILVLDNSQFQYVDPDGKMIPLPVRAKSFILTDKGIYYEDLKGHLYLRPAEFTAFEAKLVEIRNKADAAAQPATK